jgi:hypothetical protein
MVDQHRSLVEVQLSLNEVGNLIRVLFGVFGNWVRILVVVAEEGARWGMG